MKQTKKGFTLVELLVVIAILAILATVSVVGYTSFITKANISNDTVIARELTTLIQATDITDPVEDFDDVINVLYQNGFLLANLNTKTQGCFFVWESKNNQILLVDSKDNAFNVLFPEAYEPAGESWHLVCADKDLLAGLTLPQGVQIKRAAGSIDSLQEFIAEGGKIYIDESAVLETGKTIIVEDGQEVVLNFGGNSFSTNGTIVGIPLEVNNGKMTVNDAVISGSGEFVNVNGTYTASVGFDGAGTLILNNCNIAGKGNAVAGANYEDGPAYVEINGCTLSSSNIGVNMATPGTVVINDTIISSPNPIFASYGAEFTINSGNFTSTDTTTGTADTNYLFEVHSQTPDSNTTIIVKGGTFTFTNLAFFAHSNGSSIVISGGTFNGVDYLAYFNQYFNTGASIPGVNVQISNGVVTLTKA